jgi:hypothetical protein
MRPAVTIAALALVLLAACGDDDPPVAPLTLASAYRLATVDGRFVPAALDSSVDENGSNRFVRITARTLEFLTADSAQYAEASDVVERLAGGGLTYWSVECHSMRIGWRRAGNLVLLELPPAWMRPEGITDTLTIARRSLLQLHRGPTPPGMPPRRSWTLDYREGRPATPLCAMGG